MAASQVTAHLERWQLPIVRRKSHRPMMSSEKGLTFLLKANFRNVPPMLSRVKYQVLEVFPYLNRVAYNFFKWDMNEY